MMCHKAVLDMALTFRQVASLSLDLERDRERSRYSRLCNVTHTYTYTFTWTPRQLEAFLPVMFTSVNSFLPFLSLSTYRPDPMSMSRQCPTQTNGKHTDVCPVRVPRPVGP